MIDAQEAYRIGLVNKVVPQEELMEVVMKTAKKIASNAKIAVQLSKAAINHGINCDVITGIAYEDEVFRPLLLHGRSKRRYGCFCRKA